MTSSDLASWVQAFGSILAIGGSVGVAIWQSNRQHRNSLKRMNAEKKLARIESAKAILELSTNALHVLKHSERAFSNRETFHEIAAGNKYFDKGELRVIDGAIRAIPLYSLPHELVRLTMIVSSTVRQFKENFEYSINNYRKIDASEFELLRNTLTDMTGSLELTCADIQSEVSREEKQA